MSRISDELRRVADEWDVTPLYALADRIDAEADDNERFRREMEPFCDRLREAAVERADVTMFGVDYAALPLDADGLPIHIGDRVENNERVVRIVLTDRSWEPSVYVEKLPNVLHEYFCNEVSHCHEPTVEDVLREFADEVWNRCCEGATASDSGIDELVAEYAAKLRLADDAE